MQVKVWFQNRRMKWRHTREGKTSVQDKILTTPETAHMDEATSSSEDCDDEIDVVTD
jgi:hypothetical protein